MQRALLLSLLASCALVHADVRLPALISDHMLVQQQAPVHIWGWAEPGESVSVAYRDQKVAGRADTTGRWAVFLKPMQPAARIRSRSPAMA